MTFPPQFTGTPAIDWIWTVVVVAAASRGFVWLGRLGRGLAVSVAVLAGLALATVVAAATAGEDIAVDGATAAAVLLLVAAVPLVAGVGRPLGVRARGADAVTAAAGLAAVAAVAVGVGALHPAVGLVVAGLPAAALTSWAMERRRSRRPRAVVAAAIVVLVVGVGWASAQALRARADLVEARELADAGLAAATGGDVEVARDAVAEAADRFAAARRRLHDPVVAALRFVPGISQNLEAAQELAATGAEVMASVGRVADVATPERLRPSGGRFPLEAFADLHAALADAGATLTAGSARLDGATSAFLVPPVDGAIETFTRATERAEASIGTAAEAVGLAPRLLGGDRPRRWFVAVLTPSERRGAGGLLGDYALLDVTDGTVSLTDSGPIGDLNGTSPTDQQSAALPPVYHEQYSTWEVGRYWQNLTVTPDFGTIGRAVTALAPVAGIGPVDGVLSIDPLALQGLLEVTGPVEVPPWPEPVTAEDVADLLLLEQYRQLPDLEERAEFQARLVETVVDRLTDTALDPGALLDALGPAVAGGHLRLYSAAADEQAVFRAIGADGELARPSTGDYLSVVSQNGSQSKIDFFLRRAVRYVVDVDPATGETSATVEVAITNEAPAGGLDPFILGGGVDSAFVGTGEMRTFTTIFSALSVESVSIDGGPTQPVSAGIEADLHTGTVLHRIPPGTTQVLVFRLSGLLPPGDGYQLLLDHQPGVHADEVVVEVLDETFREEVRAPWTITAE